MSLTDLGSQVRKLLRLPTQNLKAWGQVATQPKLRQEYGQLVVKPAVKKAAAYIPYTSASRQRLATLINVSQLSVPELSQRIR